MAKGRSSFNQNIKFQNTIKPASGEQGILEKQDEIIDKLNAILAAIESATDGYTLFTALDTADIKENLSKLVLK